MLGVERGQPVVVARKHVGHGVGGGLLVGEDGVVGGCARVGDVVDRPFKIGLAIAAVHRRSGGRAAVVFGKERGHAAHVGPSGCGGRHLHRGVEIDGARAVVAPRASEGVAGVVDRCAVDGAVAEDVAIGAAARVCRDDVALAVFEIEQRVLEKDVAAAADEVDHAVDFAGLEIRAHRIVVRIVGVLIAQQTHVLEDAARALVLQRHSAAGILVGIVGVAVLDGQILHVAVGGGRLDADGGRDADALYRRQVVDDGALDALADDGHLGSRQRSDARAEVIFAVGHEDAEALAACVGIGCGNGFGQCAVGAHHKVVEALGHRGSGHGGERELVVGGQSVARAVGHEARRQTDGVGGAVVEVHVVEADRLRAVCGHEVDRATGRRQSGRAGAGRDAFAERYGDASAGRDALVAVDRHATADGGSLLVGHHHRRAEDIQIAEALLGVGRVAEARRLLDIAELIVGVEHVGARARQTDVDQILVHQLVGKGDADGAFLAGRELPCGAFDVGEVGAVGRHLRLPVDAGGVLGHQRSGKCGRGEAARRELILQRDVGGAIAVGIESAHGLDHHVGAVADHGRGAGGRQSRAVGHADHAGLGVAAGVPRIVGGERIGGVGGVALHLFGVEDGDEILNLVVGHNRHVFGHRQRALRRGD